MDATEHKTGHIASALQVHANTIRDWSDRYEHLLSKRATGPRRKFTPDDYLLLATVADMRDKGLSFDAITDALEAGQRIDQPPDIPTEDQKEARQQVEIVSLPRDSYLLEVERYRLQIESLESEIERLQDALDHAETDRDEYQQKLMQVTGQYEAAKARLDIITQERRPASYWLMILAAVTVTVLIIAIVLGVLLASGAG